jgi:hypothetical protein
MAKALSVLFILLLSSLVHSAELSKEEIAARDFGIGAIKLGMHRSRLNFNYTPELGDMSIVPLNHGEHLYFGSKMFSAMGTTSYVIRNGKDRYIVLGFQFDALVSISSVRENANLSAVPAIAAHQEKIIAVFGSDFYLKSGPNLTWRFPGVDRQVEYLIRNQQDERLQTVSVTVSYLHLHTSQKATSP